MTVAFLKVGAALLATGLALTYAPAAAAPDGSAVSARPDAAPSVTGQPLAGWHASLQPVAWCGSGETAENRTPEVEVSSARQVHVVYAFPSDRADSFGSFASAIASDVAAINEWWQRQDASRAPRFDLYPFPGCATRFGMLDIGVVRLPHDSSYYMGDPGFQRLAADLTSSTSNSVKTLAFYDGPAEGNVCGEAWFSPSSGAYHGVAVVFLPAHEGWGYDPGTGGEIAETATHELTHDLGAVDGAAPHECDGHVCDSSTDLMWSEHIEGQSLFGKALDVNRDDYYGHSGSWWDVQDSDWLIRLPQFALTVSVVNQGGTGTVTSQPETVACPGQCSAVWDNGALVSLLPQPAEGSRLLAWTGACTGKDACDLTLDGAKSVTATFGPSSFTISVMLTGKGRVTSVPKGISCTRGCARPFEADTTVRLTATPAKGYRFGGWKGSCAGTKACRLTIDRNRSVRAVFNRK